ncbi:hypothetical protein L1887_33975 [Cichorium endivia]|nr:hypothetical protein L1887_33975 [Cichorium endivia]
MGSDVESDPISIPKLQLFSMAVPRLPEPSGMLTPPLQTSASVPFRWEEEPGKPRPCTDLILASAHHTTTVNRCLELPPRLAMVESNIITKTPSPTTVLDGPGDTGGKSVFSSSSFRFARERRRKGHRQGSFDSNCSGGWSPNDDVGGGGQQLLLPGNKHEHQKSGRGLFGSFRLRGNHKPKDGKDSFVISPSSTSSMDTGFSFFEKKGKRMRRNSSLSKITRSHFWAAIYEGFRQVVPWKKKPKKESFPL